MSHDYLQKVLKNFLKVETLRIIEVKVSPCNSLGEGFLSLLQRTVITYEVDLKTFSLSVILKSECSDEFALKIIGEEGFDVQGKEINFFDKIAGKMLEIFKNVDKNSKVIPDVIFVDRINNVLVMEDLRELNFTMADRLVGLDEKHVKISLQKIAKFHAASLKILSENPKAFEGFDIGVISRKVSTVNLGNELGFKAAAKEISTWNGFEEIAGKMENINLLENCFKCFDVNESELNVLNHGDIWTTNLMFKYGDGGELVDAILVSENLKKNSNFKILLKFSKIFKKEFGDF